MEGSLAATLHVRVHTEVSILHFMEDEIVWRFDETVNEGGVVFTTVACCKHSGVRRSRVGFQLQYPATTCVGFLQVLSVPPKNLDNGLHADSVCAFVID